MLPRIDRDQVIIVHMTAEHNPALLTKNPPVLRREFCDSDQAADARIAALINAESWDIYKEVVQLSFRWDSRNHHFLLCEANGPPLDVDLAVPLTTPEGTITWCSTEEELIVKAFEFLWALYGGENSDGKTTYYRLLAGWETHRIVWPILANRALKYKVRPPASMLTDPERRWPTVYGLVDLSTIYSQAGSNPKYMPSLADVLRYWGFWQPGMCPRADDIRTSICLDPDSVVAWVEPYLLGMDEVMRKYYAIPEPVYSELAGVPVPPAMPVLFYPEKK